MTSVKIFQVEKNNEDIRKTILTNIVKMLVERGTIKHEELDNNIKKLIDMNPDDHIYVLNKDVKDEKKKIAIKIFGTKIASVSKQSAINDFLVKHSQYHKIIVVKSINAKTAQHVISTFPDTEIFHEHNLMINLIDNVLVPRYEVLSEATEEFNTFCEMYQCKKRNIPKLSVHDPMAKYYNLKKGDIVRIIRPSDTAGYSPYYRIVIN